MWLDSSSKSESMPDRDATQSVLSCYRCGSSLELLTLPLSRLDLCPSCSVELHVCRMCAHYAPTKPDACDEEDAIEVTNKTAANFCDYFDPDAEAFDGREKRAEDRARGELAALFGDGESDAETPDSGSAADDELSEAERLFRK